MCPFAAGKILQQMVGFLTTSGKDVPTVGTIDQVWRVALFDVLLNQPLCIGWSGSVDLPAKRAAAGFGTAYGQFFDLKTGLSCQLPDDLT